MKRISQITVIQDFATKLYPVNGKNLTEEELNKLIALMSSVDFQIVIFKDYSKKTKEVTSIEDFAGLRWRETKIYK